MWETKIPRVMWTNQKKKKKTTKTRKYVYVCKLKRIHVRQNLS